MTHPDPAVQLAAERYAEHKKTDCRFLSCVEREMEILADYALATLAALDERDAVIRWLIDEDTWNDRRAWESAVADAEKMIGGTQ